MPYDLDSSQKRLADLNTELQIDKNDLDNEIMGSAAYYNEVAQEYVRSLARRDQLKHELDLVKAQLDRQLRDRYTADGVKFTETKLENEILMQASYQNALAEFSAWRHLTEAWDALRDAVSTRSYALKDLASLYVAGYYTVEATRGAGGASETGRAARTRIAMEEDLKRKRL